MIATRTLLDACDSFVISLFFFTLILYISRSYKKILYTHALRQRKTMLNREKIDFVYKNENKESKNAIDAYVEDT